MDNHFQARRRHCCQPCLSTLEEPNLCPLACRLRYLLPTVDLALVYHRSVRPVVLTAFVDAAFANDLQQRSRYGHAIYVADCLVCWLTKATSAVCLSTAEAEFVAAAEAVKDLLWLRNFL